MTSPVLDVVRIVHDPLADRAIRPVPALLESFFFHDLRLATPDSRPTTPQEAPHAHGRPSTHD